MLMTKASVCLSVCRSRFLITLLGRMSHTQRNSPGGSTRHGQVIGKRSYSSTALLTAAMPRPAALYNRRKWQLIGKSQWCCSTNCGHPLNALTYNWTRGMQLANTPPLQSTAPGIHPVSFHQMAPPVQGNTHPITAYYSVYRPRKDERLS